MSAMLKQKLIDIANGFTKYGLWKGGGSSNLSELEDVTLTNLQTNDVLTYNGSEWVNDDNLQTQINTLNSNFTDLFETGNVSGQKITWVYHTSNAYYCDLLPITLKKNRKISYISQIVSGNMGVFRVQTSTNNTTLKIRLWSTSNSATEITSDIFKYIAF